MILLMTESVHSSSARKCRMFVSICFSVLPLFLQCGFTFSTYDWTDPMIIILNQNLCISSLCSFLLPPSQQICFIESSHLVANQEFLYNVRTELYCSALYQRCIRRLLKRFVRCAFLYICLSPLSFSGSILPVSALWSGDHCPSIVFFRSLIIVGGMDRLVEWSYSLEPTEQNLQIVLGERKDS